MRNNHLGTAFVVAAGLALAGLAISRVQAHGDDSHPATPIGAWFGIARPCTPFDNSAPHPTVDQEFCKTACGGAQCPPVIIGAPNPEFHVTMIPTLLADGTVLADDFGAVGVAPPSNPNIAGDGHTTAHGKWAFVGKQKVAGNRLDKYQASFIWFQGRFPFEVYNSASQTGFFTGSVRPRFVTFFDAKNPDVMKGTIQPFVYRYTDANGSVIQQPGSVAPDPDPVAPLPDQCVPDLVGLVTGTNRLVCLGTLSFTIRRIPVL